MAFIDTKERPQGEQVDAITPTKLKLSEAIRIGAKIRPQCSGEWYREGKSCAMGAAAEADGWKDYAVQYRNKNIVYPWMRFKKRFGIDDAMQEHIWRRNDSGESRESIADWLESQGL